MNSTSGRSLLILNLFLAAGLALVMQAPVYAQTATLVGQVADETGAVIPGVKLTLENQETGVSIEGESNEVGYYRFSFLASGQLIHSRRSSPGFTIATVENIILQINQTDDVNVTLNPSAVQEIVTVTASAVSLSTQTSELSEVVTERPVKQLPLLMRDPSSLVNLVPGVTADHRTQTRGLDRSGLSFQGRLTFCRQWRSAGAGQRHGGRRRRYLHARRLQLGADRPDARHHPRIPGDDQ